MANETVLFLAFTEPDGSLSKASLEALGAAGSLGGQLLAGLIGADVQAAANSIVSCGASRFLAVNGDAFAQPRYATDAAAAEALFRASGASIVIAPHTSRTARALPGVAQRVSSRIDTHIVEISGADGAVRVNRWYYRQRMEGTLSRSERPWFLLADSGCAAAWQGDSGTASVELVAVQVGPSLTRTQVQGHQAPPTEHQTIRPDAALLFVAGAGWTKKQKDGQAHLDDASRLILGFLNGSRASLGSSKSLVDLSGEGEQVLPFLSHLNQVGQTGATPRHPKGLSTCCHGEEPHVVGWRFIKERRAINLDANCGWARGKADVLYVADAFAVMEAVNALLKAR